MQFTTADTITNAQIEALLTGAGAAGDMEQCTICRIALDLPADDGPMGDVDPDAWTREAAIAECARVISDAEAMLD